MTLDRAVGYHQVQEQLLSASSAVEIVKTSKMYNYTYYLLVTTKLSFEYLHVVWMLSRVSGSVKLCYVGQHWTTDTLIGAHCCKLYSARTYDISRHLQATTDHWVHTRRVHVTTPRSVEKSRMEFELPLLKRLMLEL